MGLAVSEDGIVAIDQQRGVVEHAVVVLGNADGHGHPPLGGGATDRPQARAIEWLGQGGDVLRRGEAGQVGFRKDQQAGSGRAAGDGVQRGSEVVGGIAITASELDEFDLHDRAPILVVARRVVATQNAGSHPPGFEYGDRGARAKSRMRGNPPGVEA